MEYGRMISFITFLVGLLLAVYYVCLVRRYERERADREHRDRDSYILDIRGAVNKSHVDRVLKDYEIMNREVESRGNVTEAVGAILITASFLILGNAVAREVDSSLKIALAIVSMGLYLVWLFIFELTTRNLDNTTYSRMRAIEEALSDKEILGYDFGIHRYIRGQTRDAWWMMIRRRIWVIILILLFFGWALVLGLTA